MSDEFFRFSHENGRTDFNPTFRRCECFSKNHTAVRHIENKWRTFQNLIVTFSTGIFSAFHKMPERVFSDAENKFEVILIVIHHFKIPTTQFTFVCKGAC